MSCLNYNRCDCVGLTARGTLLLALGPSAGGAAAEQRRTLQQLQNDHPVLAVAKFAAALTTPPTQSTPAGPAMEPLEPSGAAMDDVSMADDDISIRTRKRVLQQGSADSAAAGSDSTTHRVQQGAGGADGAQGDAVTRDDFAGTDDAAMTPWAALRSTWSALGGREHGLLGGQAAQLPRNVHLLTLQAVGERKALVRLAHLYQVGCC